MKREVNSCLYWNDLVSPRQTGDRRERGRERKKKRRNKKKKRGGFNDQVKPNDPLHGGARGSTNSRNQETHIERETHCENNSRMRVKKEERIETHRMRGKRCGLVRSVAITRHLPLHLAIEWPARVAQGRGERVRHNGETEKERRRERGEEKRESKQWKKCCLVEQRRWID